MRATIHMTDGSHTEISCPQAQCGSDLRRWLRDNIGNTRNIDIITTSLLHIYPEEIPTGVFWFDLHRNGSDRYEQTEYCKRGQLRKANLYARVEAKRAGIPYSKVN